MDELKELRDEIDRVDREMASLFEARMAAARAIAAYKKEHGLPVEDKSREEEMLRSEVSLVSPDVQPYFARFLRTAIELSKEYQRTVQGDAAPSGCAGTAGKTEKSS